ncbi:MAG: hypothetical protein FWG50_02765 [Kiritimatiellaeota bacterium]|nr:hypothetical protein [Kiritimatiellota bacterium]
MNWFAKNVLLLNLMVLVGALAWIHGGTRPDLLFPVIPWLTLPVLEWLLVYPQVKKSESLLDARRRVWRGLARDPLTYLSVLFTVVLLIPVFNVAVAPQDVGGGSGGCRCRRWRGFRSARIRMCMGLSCCGSSRR